MKTSPALVLALSALFAAAPQARAQQAAETGFDPRAPLRLFLEREATQLPGRVEVNVEPLDERVKLAPCQQVEPFVPAGARLWGKTRLGVRCVKGAAWSVLLPAEIRVFAPALVAARPITANEPVGPEDFRTDEVELTREPAGVLTQAAQIGSSVASRAIQPGQALRKDMLRPKPVISQGDVVKLVYAGRGFSVTSSGRAMNPAADGQAVRVQAETGRILTGTARGGRVVDVTN